MQLSGDLFRTQTKILDQVADYLFGSLAVETVLGYVPVPVQLLNLRNQLIHLN